jgi:hypothetical protein
MYNGYIYSKDDIRSPFVKPPWLGQVHGYIRLARDKKLMHSAFSPVPSHSIQLPHIQGKMQLLYNMKLVSGIHGKQRLNFQRF